MVFFDLRFLIGGDGVIKIITKEVLRRFLLVVVVLVVVVVVVGGEKQGRRNRRRASILVIFVFGYLNKRRNGLVFSW